MIYLLPTAVAYQLANALAYSLLIMEAFIIDNNEG